MASELEWSNRVGQGLPLGSHANVIVSNQEMEWGLSLRSFYCLRYNYKALKVE